MQTLTGQVVGDRTELERLAADVRTVERRVSRREDRDWMRGLLGLIGKLRRHADALDRRPTPAAVAKAERFTDAAIVTTYRQSEGLKGSPLQRQMQQWCERLIGAIAQMPR